MPDTIISIFCVLTNVNTQQPYEVSTIIAIFGEIAWLNYLALSKKIHQKCLVQCLIYRQIDRSLDRWTDRCVCVCGICIYHGNHVKMASFVWWDKTKVLFSFYTFYIFHIYTYLHVFFNIYNYICSQNNLIAY